LQRARESSLRFNLRRFAGFFKVLFKNRTSAAGFVILIISVSVALSATSVFPTNPQNVIVGAKSVPPEWVSYFSEGTYLSKNIVVVNDPTFSSPSSIQEWSSTVSDSTLLPSVSVSYAPRTISANVGSLKISYSSTTPGNVTVVKTFHYPYKSPPLEFRDLPADYRIHADGVSVANPVVVRFFIERLSGASPGHSFDLWTTSINSTGPISDTTTWTNPAYLVDSESSLFPLYTTLGASSGLTSLHVSEIVFPSAGDYVYGFQASFHGPASLYVTNLGLTLYGSSYGILGTDYRGEDLFAQNLWGSRVSLYVGLVAAFIGIFLGLVIGLLAGYMAGLTDEVLMRFTDMMLVIPSLPLLIVLIAVLGASLTNLIIVIGFLGWMGFARVIRSQVLSLRERPFIEAAKAAGSGTTHILTKHVFPNIVSLTYVNLALSVPAAILSEAALSFLGLGDPSNISWGQILQIADINAATRFWWNIVPPGLGIAVVSLAFILVGQGLDEIFNPKLRRRR
jgi:peptide/nickel transport system permease protein